MGFSVLILSFYAPFKRAFTQRVNKEGDASHYRIDGNSNLRHNLFTEHMFWKYDSAKKNVDIAVFRDLGQTVASLPGNTKGATVTNYLRVNTSIVISKKHTPREYCEMEQVLRRRRFDKHLQRAII